MIDGGFQAGIVVIYNLLGIGFELRLNFCGARELLVAFQLMKNALINTEMFGRQVIDQALTKIIKGFFVQLYVRFFARLNANQIVVSHEQMLTYMQLAINQFVTFFDALCQVIELVKHD